MAHFHNNAIQHLLVQQGLTIDQFQPAGGLKTLCFYLNGVPVTGDYDIVINGNRISASRRQHIVSYNIVLYMVKNKFVVF